MWWKPLGFQERSNGKSSIMCGMFCWFWRLCCYQEESTHWNGSSKGSVYSSNVWTKELLWTKCLEFCFIFVKPFDTYCELFFSIYLCGEVFNCVGGDCVVEEVYTHGSLQLFEGIFLHIHKGYVLYCFNGK